MAATPQSQQLPSPLTQLAVKLDATNYVVWKLQIEPFLAEYDLIGHVDGTTNPPERTTVAGGVNPGYTKWYRQDQLVLGWLINSLSSSVIHTLVGVQTAREAWRSLATAFGTRRSSLVRSLRSQLLNLRLSSALTHDNNLAILFYRYWVCIQDLESRRIVYQGQSKNGLYTIPLSLLHRVQPKVNSATLTTWHRRLGHANMENVKRTLHNSDIIFF
ncbi:Retrovirus-related Pol polyprotein from transposon RE1 [Linum perenne]